MFNRKLQGFIILFIIEGLLLGTNPSVIFSMCVQHSCEVWHRSVRIANKYQVDSFWEGTQNLQISSKYFKIVVSFLSNTQQHFVRYFWVLRCVLFNPWLALRRLSSFHIEHALTYTHMRIHSVLLVLCWFSSAFMMFQIGQYSLVTVDIGY